MGVASGNDCNLMYSNMVRNRLHAATRLGWVFWGTRCVDQERRMRDVLQVWCWRIIWRACRSEKDGLDPCRYLKRYEDEKDMSMVIQFLNTVCGSHNDDWWESAYVDLCGIPPSQVRWNGFDARSFHGEKKILTLQCLIHEHRVERTENRSEWNDLKGTRCCWYKSRGATRYGSFIRLSMKSLLVESMWMTPACGLVDSKQSLDTFHGCLTVTNHQDFLIAWFLPLRLPTHLLHLGTHGA